MTGRDDRRQAASTDPAVRDAMARIDADPISKIFQLHGLRPPHPQGQWPGYAGNLEPQQ